ncbi:MAG: hypothetical protein V1792_16770 [Pseudomonadota bacterium]
MNREPRNHLDEQAFVSSYPVASIEAEAVSLPASLTPGIDW